MSASKLALCGIGTALFRNPRTLSPNSPSFFLFAKPTLFPLKTPPPPSFHRHHCSSSATAATLSAVDQGHLSQQQQQQQQHPWPEWISFVDRLNTKGYLTKPSSSSSSSSGDDGGDDAFYVNVNLVKDGCLSFARDRYDLLKLLSTKDVQAVVEGGCPNLLRKAVNSAKRLRAHLQLDEGDICSACNLRGSCDRAYVILKEFEADARTVDIVRILLFYALDPLVLSGGERPSGREFIESSVRNLLSQLIELSESSPAPPPVPAASKPIAQDAVTKRQSLTSPTYKLSSDVEMKKGDWICPKCNFTNFSRNMQCLECKEDRPKDGGLPTIQMKQGDWICPDCSFLNFAKNKQCLKCKTEGPKRAEVKTKKVEMKNGDWTCPQCGSMNFASNMKCFRCPEPRPKKHPGDWNCSKCGFMNFASKVKCLRCQEPNPRPKSYRADWSCPKCDFYNYARNKDCLKCNTQRPKEQSTSEYEEHLWK